MTEAKKERVAVFKVKALSKVRTWMVAVAVFMSGTSQHSRSIFGGSSDDAKANPCRVVKPDLSYKLSLDLLQKWRFNSDDQGYPMGTVVVSFLYYDDTADDKSLSILLEERDSYGEMKLMPVKGYANNKGESLWEAAVRYGKQVMPSLDENDLHLLNAVHTEHPLDESEDPEKVLYTSFVVFVSDKSEMKTMNHQWYRIKGDTLLSEDRSTEIKKDRYWFMTKEDMLSIDQFVDCPNHPANLPDIPEPVVVPDPTENDKQKQRQFYKDRGCMVDGDRILYRGKKGRKMQQQCHHALIYEMKRVCGDNKFSVSDASKVRCLIHGASSKYQWKMPRKSTLDTEPELWGVSVLESYEYDLQFGWLFMYTFSEDKSYGGMVAILEVSNTDNCKYREQFSDSRRGYIAADYAVVRYTYSNSDKTYPTIDNDLVPDAWIYTSNAANMCGLRLLKQYYFQPQPIVKCQVKKPLLFDGLSKSNGYRGQLFCVLPLYWDDMDNKSLSLAVNKNLLKLEVTCDISYGDSGGHYPREYAAQFMFPELMKDIRNVDVQLLGSYKSSSNKIHSVFGIFLKEKKDFVLLKWISMDQLQKGKVESQIKINTIKKILDNIECE